MARIIVVDDDERLAGLVVEVLTGLGHRAAAARDLEEFSFMLQGGVPDLAVLDMQFRGGGAPAAIKLLPPSLPVLVMSGMPADKQQPWFAGRERVRHLVKPLKTDLLKAALAELLPPA